MQRLHNGSNVLVSRRERISETGLKPAYAFVFAWLTLTTSIRSVQGDPPYPPSPVIVDIMWAPKDKIVVRDAYEFFAGLDAEMRPLWSRDINERSAIFEHHDACLRSAMTWNPGLGRYLWWQHVPLPVGAKDRGDTRFAGGFGLYDAPEPWGP